MNNKLNPPNLISINSKGWFVYSILVNFKSTSFVYVEYHSKKLQATQSSEQNTRLINNVSKIFESS